MSPVPHPAAPARRWLSRAAVAGITTVVALVLSLSSLPALADEPTAIAPPTDLAVTGTPTVGETLSIRSDGWDPADAVIRVDWSVDSVDVASTVSSDEELALELQPEWVGKSVTAHVHASAEGREDFDAILPGPGAISPATWTAAKPTISGTAKTKGVLRASVGTLPSGTKAAYRWLVDGSPISGATGSTYTVPASRVGHDISVRVELKRTGFTTLTLTSAAKRISTAPFTTKPKPKLSNAPRVGRSVTALVGSWKPGATFTYKWRVSGKVVSTAKKYTPKASQRGKYLTVTVTAKRTGYTTTVQKTAKTKIGYGVFTKHPKPKISGSPAVGSKLKAKAGTWAPSATIRYQWLNNGKAIKGATKSTYTVKKGDWKDRISVRVTASKTGYATKKVTSSSVRAVKKFTRTATPKISATGTRVWSTLTAKVGSWSPSPKFTYQWKRNGSKIPGATKKTYKTTSADYGKQITVTVTAHSSLRVTTSRTSKATAKIKAPAPTITKSGTYKVGSQIKPGTYVANAKFGCYWERRSKSGSSITGVIANDFVGYDGRVIVTISSSDKYFSTDADCGSWTKYVKLGKASSKAKDGTYVVGDQLRPGTYIASGGWDGCYWARLSGFSGRSGDIKENDFTYDYFNVVWISPNDRGFHTSGCGTWERIGS